MTNLPDDLVNPAEGRLIRRVHAWSDPAVVPIDPVAVAAVAALTRPRRGVAGGLGRLGRLGWLGRLGRLGWLAAGAALTGVLIGGAMGIGALSGPAATASPAATPAAADVLRTCTPVDVNAVIIAWGGAAGHRIATVELHQIGTTACAVASEPEPWLADGNGTRLIVGKAGVRVTTIRFEPGAVLHTLVQAGNYCGPAPVAPVTVAFTQLDATFVATALTPTDLSGVPPCNGTAGPTDDITMHPWELRSAVP